MATSPFIEPAIRPHLAGRFEDLLISAATHPLMLHALDQNAAAGPNSPQAQSFPGKKGLNDNLAQELLELHTLGVDGSYTQVNVRELAELLTGLAFTPEKGRVFRRPLAEPGAETVLGVPYGGDYPARLDGIHAALRDLPDPSGFVETALGARATKEVRFAAARGEGRLVVIHAVSAPHRDKRSHFDGQDQLEAGVGPTSEMPQDGWLNRVVQSLPGATADTAYAIGSDPFLILKGAAPVSRWTPEADLHLSPQALDLTRRVMASDPAMSAALATAFDLAERDGDALIFTGNQAEMMAAMREDMMSPAQRRAAGAALAKFAGERLREEARIACYSLTGWDTHRGQDSALPRALSQLQQSLLTLKETLGAAAWGQTAVVAVTEFGRTARWNGTGGTDHGTGGAMVLAGGAVRGGRVVADWPGLAEADLYERRDLMPTRDTRAHLAWLLQGLFGLRRDVLERDVFPGIDMGADPGLFL